MFGEELEQHIVHAIVEAFGYGQAEHAYEQPVQQVGGYRGDEKACRQDPLDQIVMERQCQKHFFFISVCNKKKKKKQ